MKKNYYFDFVDKDEALSRGASIKEKIEKQFADAKVEYEYAGGCLKIMAESNSAEALLRVPVQLLEDENLDCSIFCFVPLIAIQSMGLFNTKMSGAMAGDLASNVNRKELAEKFDLPVWNGAYREALDEHLSHLGLRRGAIEEEWKPRKKLEISRRYFPENKVQLEGFKQVAMRHKIVFDCENYFDERMQKFFIPILPKSTLYPWLEYMGDYVLNSYRWVSAATYNAVDKIARDNGYPYVYDPLTKNENMDGMMPDFWKPKNVELLSRKYYPDLWRKYEG